MTTPTNTTKPWYINLSTYQLSQNEINILAKGLNFSPNMALFKRQSDSKEVIGDLRWRINTTLYFNNLNQAD